MAGGGDDEDMGALAWPGFVDILSSVLIMFVFLVLIIAVALYFYTLTYTSTVDREAVRNAIIEQISDASAQAAAAEIVSELRRENASLKQKVGMLSDRIKMLGASMSDSIEQKTFASDGGRELIIMFGSDAITVTPETKEKIEEFIDKHRTENPDLSFDVLAVKNREAPTESIARTIALSRMFNVRNVLIEDDVDTKTISLSIISGEKIDDSYHWVKLVATDGK